MPLLNSLDLFSGIGGFTRALEGVAKPVAFCEIDAGCQAVLNKHFPHVPIFTDVRKLSAKNIKKPIDIIMGGWPCQDISGIGKQRGLAGDRSGLIKEVFRLTDELQPKLVFLENVPMILHNGIDVIKSEFCKKRGYKMRWAIIPASAVGAPHYRKRWFCLLIKRGHVDWANSIKIPVYESFKEIWDSVSRGGATPHSASASRGGATPQGATPRMVIPRNMAHKNEMGARASMLGNSVVPDCVRLAFKTLMHDFNDAKKRGHEDPKEGVWGDDKKQYRGIRYKKPNLHLVLDPKLYKGTVKGPQTCDELPGPTIFRGWSTPRHSSHTSNVLTTRTCRDLPTQVRFEKSTPNHLRRGVLNPEFLEWMMGYPKDWTRK